MTKKYNYGIILKEPKTCHRCNHTTKRTKAYKDLSGHYSFDCVCDLNLHVPSENVDYSVMIERQGKTA